MNLARFSNKGTRLSPDEINKLAADIRARSNKMTRQEREDSLARAMEIIRKGRNGRDADAAAFREIQRQVE